MTTATISFVIPVLNEAAEIVSLLEWLVQRFPGVQRIVVDGGSNDRTAELARPLCKLLCSEPGRARQMNHGAAEATGTYLVFLHADTRPEFDQRELFDMLAAQPSWGFCRVRLSGSSRLLRLVEGLMNARSRLTGIATGDQMLFVQRDLFQQLGGFAAIPLMEDIEFSKRLRCHAAPLSSRLRVCTSSRRWEQRGVLRTIVLMWRLRLAYAMGASPDKLWRAYYGQQ